jgi:hypothetical protein
MTETTVNGEGKVTFSLWFLDMMRKQGFSVALLILGIYFLGGEVKDNKAELKAMRTQYDVLLIDLHTKTVRTLELNTVSMNENNDLLMEIKELLKDKKY